MPHISLVFRELQDTTKASSYLCILNHSRLRAVVSHISRKTSEMWGARERLQIRKVMLYSPFSSGTAVRMETGGCRALLEKGI